MQLQRSQNEGANNRKKRRERHGLGFGLGLSAFSEIRNFRVGINTNHQRESQSYLTRVNYSRSDEKKSWGSYTQECLQVQFISTYLVDRIRRWCMPSFCHKTGELYSDEQIKPNTCPLASELERRSNAVRDHPLEIKDGNRSPERCQRWSLTRVKSQEREKVVILLSFV